MWILSDFFDFMLNNTSMIDFTSLFLQSIFKGDDKKHWDILNRFYNV